MGNQKIFDFLRALPQIINGRSLIIVGGISILLFSFSHILLRSTSLGGDNSAEYQDYLEISQGHPACHSHPIVGQSWLSANLGFGSVCVSVCVSVLT